MEIKFVDLPDWAREEVGKIAPCRRPRAYIVYTETLDLGPVWHEACQREVFARNATGEIVRAQSAYYGSLLASNKLQQTMYFGGKTLLPPDGEVLVVEVGPGDTVRPTLYRHPSQAPKVIGEDQELDPWEFFVLNVLASYTSAGRADAWRRHRVPPRYVENGVLRLQSKKLLSVTRAGAIRVNRKGRNARAEYSGPKFRDREWRKAWNAASRSRKAKKNRGKEKVVLDEDLWCGAYR